ncbi:MAG: Planctomycete cytochrome, partial [Armatimonadetes bacterium]|nr:Planctomycete cytochrome [Armatimonadota bacterium]
MPSSRARQRVQRLRCGEPGRAALVISGFLALLPAAALTAPRAAAPVAPVRPPVSYERDVLPLFQRKCLGCHGAGQPNAGLDVTSAGALLEGGYSGPSVVPGAPEKSLLYQMLVDGRMPKGGGRFSAAELKSVAGWIRAGAPGAATQGHWAFRSPSRPAVPMVKAAARVRNPIDNFILAALEKQGLTYSPEADPRTLIRRVTYDLTGLPPTPTEVEAFVRECAAEPSLPPTPNTQHPTPGPYDRLVDRLLASPAYGERAARHWLDAAGYADSEGVLQEDRIRPNAWRYRDYVIRAFNADKPYDQFLREQIAGDELSDYRHARVFTPELVDTLAATGFLRTAVDGTRDDFNPHQFGEYQYRMLHDTQTIVMSTTLGLTVQCARCHDHKYEPLSQKDYYRLQGLFTPAVRPRGTLLPTNRRQIIAATAEEQQRAKEVNAAVEAALARLNQQQVAVTNEFRLKSLEANSGAVPEAERAALLLAARIEEPKRTAEQKALVARYRTLVEPAMPALEAAFPELKQKVAVIAAERAGETRKRIVLPEIRAFYDQDATPPPTQLLVRGDWLRPGDPVEPGLPTVLARPGDGF